MRSLSDLTLLDLLVLLIVFSSIVHHTLRGFLRGVLGIGGAIAALVLAGLFYRDAASIFRHYSESEALANLLGFMGIFVATILVKELITYTAYKLIRAIHLDWLDRTLGGLFGLITGWLIGAVLFLALTAFPVKIEAVQRSALAPYLLFGARLAVNLVPRDLKQEFYLHYRQVLELWKEQANVRFIFKNRLQVKIEGPARFSGHGDDRKRHLL